jgi:hypothetical protein
MNLQFALALAGCSSGFYLLCKMLLQIAQTVLDEELATVKCVSHRQD